MPLGDFTITFDGDRLGAGTETSATLQIQILGQDYIKDADDNKVYFSHRSAVKPVSVSLPTTETLKTDVTSGSSTVIAYRLRVSTAFGSGGVVDFMAPAAGSALNFADLVSNYAGPPVPEDIATRAEDAADAAAASAASVNREQPNGTAGLDSGGKLFVSRIPDLTGTYASIVHRPINVREAYGTSDANVRAALTAANSGSRELYFPAGLYTPSGDLNITATDTVISGDGDRTRLGFTGGGLIIDGTASVVENVRLSNLKVSRTGTAGPALHFKGNGTTNAPVRFTVNNVDIPSSTGEGMLFAGSYIGTIAGCYWSTCTTAVKITNASGGTATGNNLSFLGGEIHACGVGVYMKDALGVNFYGTGIETCTTSGVEIDGASFGVNFQGCYLEANAGWDFKIGTNERPGLGGPSGIVIAGNYISDTTANKDYSIVLVRSRGLKLDSNFFAGYGIAEVRVQEAAAGKVVGVATNNDRENFAAIRTELNGATSWNRSASSGQHQAVTVAGINPASIAANSEANLTVTVPGVLVGDDVTLHTDALFEAGLSVAQVSATATNTVQVRLRNNTGSAIDPATATWRFRVWR